MRTRNFLVPQDLIFEFVEAIEENDFANHIVGIAAESEIEISIGYNTVETSGGIDGKPIRPMIGSKRMGVSKLLSEYDRDGKTELSALDRKLRQNQLNGHLPSAINTWAEAIVGHVAEKWEKHLSQIGRIVLVGGGARYAEPFLRRRFGEKIWIPDEPIVAIARGLYKRAVYDGKK